MFNHYKMVSMNPSQPNNGQLPNGLPVPPSRPYTPSTPVRPSGAYPTPAPRPALDVSGITYRTASPAAMTTPIPPPVYRQMPPAIPAQPYRPPTLSAPAPKPIVQQPAPQSFPAVPAMGRTSLNNVQDIQNTRPTAPTVYSDQAMRPGETEAEHQLALTLKASAEEQHTAETEEILRRVPPPVSIPPKTVLSHPNLTERLSEKAGRILKTLTSIGVFFGLVWGGATLLNAFVFQSYYVDGLSMQPALGNDDRLIISKIERTRAQVESSSYIPERGQIIVIDGKVSEYTQKSNEQLIKRVIGLPGDTVIIQNGIVMIKNKANPEGFNADKVLGLDVDATFTEQPLIAIVPDDHVFVLGDNRTNGGSHDSRAFGVIPSEMVLGRLWARILPTDRLSVF